MEKEFKGVVYLEQNKHGDIDLKTDIPNDPDWYILTLKFNGTIEKCESLPDNIGLQVDDNGRIIESGE